MGEVRKLGVDDLHYGAADLESAGGVTIRSVYLRGTETFDTESSVTVTLDSEQDDATYIIVVTGDAEETFWVSGKATTGFTINSSNSSSVASVDWILVR